jgi:phosphoribosylformylglycinamidine synthase
MRMPCDEGEHLPQPRGLEANAALTSSAIHQQHARCPACDNRSSMKARVFVTPKSTVLDPQGQTVRSALNGLGFAAIAEVRQGKFFEIALASGTTREQAQTDIETIAHEVLANPVIEEYRVEILD